jgi:vancomycin resistance protein YoaR
MSVRSKKVLEWTIITVLGVIFALLVSLFFYQKTYAGKIYYNVSVSGIDLSGKTKKQAEALLQNKFTAVTEKDVTFTAEDKEVTVPVADTGLSFNVSQAVNNAYSTGRSEQFFNHLWESAKTVLSDQKIDVPAEIDEAKFNTLTNEKLPGLNVEAQNAQVKVESGVVSIVSEQGGQLIDTDNLADKIIGASADKNSGNTLRVTLDVTPVTATILSQNLNTVKTEAEKTIAKNLTLIYEGTTYTPTKSDIGTFLSFDASGDTYAISYSENAIKTYLSKIAKNFEIQKKDRKINATDNSVIEEGIQGKYLDKNAATAKIKVELSKTSPGSIALATYTEDPKELKVFPNEGIVPGRYEGKYIDIDLAQQKLCQIEGNNILGCYSVSTGKPSTPTPVGTRYVMDKNPRAWSAPYGLYMPWWMGMGGGYGIHELPEWPGGYKEGANHLGTPVSHGCVRLGVGPAEVMYNWADIGTPVYIHK